ncbi:MAG: hypothetical protein TUN42_09060 [Dehalogenimonas sp.]
MGKQIALMPFDFKNNSYVWSKRDFSGFVSHKRFLKIRGETILAGAAFLLCRFITERVAQMMQSGICFNSPGPVSLKNEREFRVVPVNMNKNENSNDNHSNVSVLSLSKDDIRISDL